MCCHSVRVYPSTGYGITQKCFSFIQSGYKGTAILVPGLTISFIFGHNVYLDLCADVIENQRISWWDLSVATKFVISGRRPNVAVFDCSCSKCAQEELIDVVDDIIIIISFLITTEPTTVFNATNTKWSSVFHLVNTISKLYGTDIRYAYIPITEVIMHATLKSSNKNRST